MDELCVYMAVATPRRPAPALPDVARRDRGAAELDDMFPRAATPSVSPRDEFWLQKRLAAPRSHDLLEKPAPPQSSGEPVWSCEQA